MLLPLPESRVVELLAPLHDCRLCPHSCGANRLAGRTGVCGSDSKWGIASICRHFGEEPVISGENGICNVFFSRCNLQCIYCQNHQISSSKGDVIESELSLHDIVSQIVTHLQSGCHAVGFVSPTHRIPQVKAITESLWLNGFSPVIIYNTNAYDKVEELQALEKYVDVYLPDFKYSDDELARKLSGIRNYSSIALTAIKEMYRQRGSTLIMEDGVLRKGLIVRHLVLPGLTENSINVLHSLADISTSIALSLMAQYQPTEKVKSDEKLGFNIQPSEYQKVCDEMERIGFYKGWIQELESSSYYNPDFEKKDPFGNKTG